MSEPDSLAHDLINHLYITHANTPAAERRNSRWVMNNEWWLETRPAVGVTPRWPPSVEVETLFGLPVEIRADGGVPHLEPLAS